MWFPGGFSFTFFWSGSGAKPTSSSHWSFSAPCALEASLGTPPPWPCQRSNNALEEKFWLDRCYHLISVHLVINLDLSFRGRINRLKLKPSKIYLRLKCTWNPTYVSASRKEVVGLGRCESEDSLSGQKSLMKDAEPLCHQCISLAWHQQVEDVGARLLGSWEYWMCGYPVACTPTCPPNSYDRFPHAHPHLSTCDSLLLHRGVLGPYSDAVKYRADKGPSDHPKGWARRLEPWLAASW